MDDPIAVLERLLDSSKWPTYRSRQHSKLWELAKDAYDRGTFDGYLSYVLITSQYCEDFARILLKEAQFTLQICLGAKKFGWHFPKKQTGANLDGLMFGQLLDMLDHSVDFDQKKEFIEACKKLSSARNRLAHELDKGVLTLPDIAAIAKDCLKLGEEITDCFNSADEHFSSFFLQALEDTGWDTLLQERMRGATADQEILLGGLQVELQTQRERSPLRRGC
jgi:hypothetical protein